MYLPVVVALLSTIVLAVDQIANQHLDRKLFTSPTELDRLSNIPDDNDWTFDYTAQDSYTYAPGSVINANAATFPAAVGHGLTMARISLGPCAMLPPHYHPRGSNYVTAIEGETVTYMILENGARTVMSTLTPGKMTIFPQASVHAMENQGCENATLISALNSEDTGTHNIVNSIFGLPSHMVNAAFGEAGDRFGLGKDVPDVGAGSIHGSTECLRRCGLA